ncbi:hypothetical protein FRC17_008617 [Serendipita sp. 399]|nr:hypothetical protein FRC17_008617 [Serendipita sp. 399]
MPAIFYAPAAFEAFVFALTAFRAWKDAQILAGPSSAPFLLILYRAKNPVIVASTQKEFVPAPATLARRGSGFLRVGGNRTAQGIPMQVHTFTEIHIDDEEISNTQYMPKRKGNLMDEGGYQSRRIETRTLDTKRISIYDGSDGYTTHSKSPA